MLLPLAGCILPSPVSVGRVVVLEHTACRSGRGLGPAGQLCSSSSRASAGAPTAAPQPRGSDEADPFATAKELVGEEVLSELEKCHDHSIALPM